MYQAYLVDDEALVLSDMRHSVPWEENNFMVAGASTDPDVAIRDVLTLSPDVVFTDMKMGRMSGLDLIAALKAKGCRAEYVVVSAYDSFDYARRLIVLEGFDYLVKPVDPVQFADLFKRLRSRLDAVNGKAARPQTASPDLNHILKYLEAHYAQKQSLQQIAERFAITPSYVCRLFAKHLDTTFSTHLAGLRMARAAHLLETSDMPIKEIAALSGYDDYFYFCRVFREANGCTPTQYRGKP